MKWSRAQTGGAKGCRRHGAGSVCAPPSSSEGLLYGLQERTPVTSTTRWGPAGYLWKLCPGKNVQICCLFPASRPPQPLSCPGSLPRLFPCSAHSALELNLGASRMPNPGSCPSPWCPHTLPWCASPTLLSQSPLAGTGIFQKEICPRGIVNGPAPSRPLHCSASTLF